MRRPCVLGRDGWCGRQQIQILCILLSKPALFKLLLMVNNDSLLHFP